MKISSKLQHFCFSFEYAMFKCVGVITLMSISSAIVFRWISQNPTDGKSTLVQVMASCCQAASHYLNQCWQRFIVIHNEVGWGVLYWFHSVRPSVCPSSTLHFLEWFWVSRRIFIYSHHNTIVFFSKMSVHSSVHPSIRPSVTHPMSAL